MRTLTIVSAICDAMQRAALFMPYVDESIL
jgi:hypothetical protein